MSFLKITIDLVTGFFLMFIIVKVVGRKIINHISPFTFITSLMLSEMLGNAMYEKRVGVFHIIYSMCLWGALLFIVEFLERKSLFFRGIFQGKPTALIKNGVVDREALKKCRMNLNQLQSLLRQSETFSIREVAFCYLEANGALSILKKARYQKTTMEDFNLPRSAVYIPVTLIRDGKVLWDEIKDLGYDESWLKMQLSSHNISNYKDVFLAEWLEGDGIFVQTNQTN
ncbi:DUF421 domain-containing protein [Bacillus sp. FJAT-29790]|uniref:DUF421 domain-containing protein n=1 Tax=Bacillus sp. FJAT-29790 TaxID=1895002 RepID=UPI001C2250C9|nr:DUF421 domain-containing protein [Bacillus sp. FJAT-29790]MBU8880476.1 DUF421 domain-containing protein [Bacillus sp. FJAT-29790]